MEIIEKFKLTVIGKDEKDNRRKCVFHFNTFQELSNFVGNNLCVDDIRDIMGEEDGVTFENLKVKVLKKKRVKSVDIVYNGNESTYDILILKTDGKTVTSPIHFYYKSKAREYVRDNYEIG